MATKRRVVEVKVLPGEPLDGTGKVCIHLFVKDEAGPFVEPHALHLEATEDGLPANRLVSRPTRGRLACDPRRTVAPVTRGGITTVTPRSDDPRAVTCFKCKKSPEYAKTMALLEGATSGG